MRQILVLFVAAGMAFLSTASPCHAVNSVIVESRTFSPGATACSVGVFITNDVGITALTLPFEVRSVSGGAYPSGSPGQTTLGGPFFGYQPGTRVYLSPLGPGADPGGQWPPAGVTLRRFDDPAANSCSGPVSSSWTTASALPSPDGLDAVFLSMVSTGDPGIGEEIAMPPGADPLGTSHASFLFQFDANHNVGSFVIDTCCVTPASHLIFVNEQTQAFVPAFGRGVIRLGCDQVSTLDTDFDGVRDSCDNCAAIANAGQEDADGDGMGDVCDPCPLIRNVLPFDSTDSDGDGIFNVCDNCPSGFNPLQQDGDNDGIGDACDNCPTVNAPPQPDIDGDGLGAICDNCPEDYNPGQANVDGDQYGDVCDPCPLDPLNDPDADGVCNTSDNCPSAYNPNQLDTDGDGVGDICDNCPTRFNPLQEDTDADGRPDSCDNCPTVFNASQTDTDLDGIGNACDNCPNVPNPTQADSDQDGVGDLCDACPADPLNDPDADGVCNSGDNCPTAYNPDQADADQDGIGDVCECRCLCHADPVCDSVCDVLDVVTAENVAFRGTGAISDPNGFCPRERADVDCSGAADVIDVVKVINVAFRGANAATEFCNPCP